MKHFIAILLINIGFLIQKHGCQILLKQNVTILNCTELFSTSVEIECFYESNVTSCDEPMLNGTIAKLKCKDSYFLESVQYDEIYCNAGQWNRPVFNCKPVCGKIIPIGTKLVISGEKAERGRFPWHIALYKKKRKAHAYICGGSIVSPKLVITAAHCFYSIEPKLYAVAAGKFYRKWNSEFNENVQRREIVDIIISKGYKGDLNGFAADIALLVVKEAFILSNLIRPVCWDHNTISFHMKTNIAEVPGWGLTAEHGKLSDYLQYAALPIIKHEDCFANVPSDFSSYVTLDKICAGYNNDSGINVCQGDSGGGLVASRRMNENREQYYLIGLVSTSPIKEDSCDSYSYTTFTNIAMYADWINETTFQYESWSPYDYGCFLPEPPSFGNYTIDAPINDGRDPIAGSLVPQYTKLTYVCYPGYQIKGEKTITCKKKVWFVNNYLPSCFRMCPKLESSELDVQYSFDGTSEPINGTYSHETHAFFRCRDVNYELEASELNQTTCRDGQWTKPVPKCIPICGVSGREPLLLTSRQFNVVYPGQYPWIVRIHLKTASGKLSAVNCSGTIISPWIVVTEIPCVPTTNLSNYVVVAENELDSFESPFQLIPIHRKISHYEFDVVILKTRLVMTSFIRPVCIDKKIFQHLKNAYNIELPFWTSADTTLKVVQMRSKGGDLFTMPSGIVKGKSRCGYFRPGAAAIPLKSEYDTRYYLFGFGKKCIKKKRLGIHVFTEMDIDFIQNTVQQFEIKLPEISECVVPDVPSHGKIIGDIYSPGELVLEETRINYLCDSYYSLTGSNEIVCKNSTWIYPSEVPRCIGCGVSKLGNINFNTSETIVGLRLSEPHTFPWHVGVVRVDKYNRQKPRMICSGTIISPKIILSVGNMLYQYRNLEENDLWVVAGLDYFKWDNSTDWEGKYIIVNELFFENKDKLLVVLILKSPLKIIEYVLPICVDMRGLMRNTRASMNTIMPIWEDASNNSKELKYTILPENLVLMTNISFLIKYRDNNGSLNFIPSTSKGSGTVYKIERNTGPHYFICSVLSEIHSYGVDFIDLYANINWLKNIISKYN